MLTDDSLETKKAYSPDRQLLGHRLVTNKSEDLVPHTYWIVMFNLISLDRGEMGINEPWEGCALDGEFWDGAAVYIFGGEATPKKGTGARKYMYTLIDELASEKSGLFLQREGRITLNDTTQIFHLNFHRGTCHLPNSASPHPRQSF